MPELTPQQRQDIRSLMAWIYNEADVESWAELARRAGVLPSTLSDWSRGHNGPSAPNMIRLLRAARIFPPPYVRKLGEPLLPVDPAVLLQQLEDTFAAAIPVLREALLPQEPSSQADGAR